MPTIKDSIGFSYRRFSDPQQGKGDSIRRQTDDAEEWCQRYNARPDRRYNVRLDNSLTLEDRGVSAFRGKHRSNPDKYALAGFLDYITNKRVPKDSFLIIENLDRLSREEERKALRLWMDILDAGVNIVQLSPETIFWHDKYDIADIMRAVIELSRGHSESREKARRVGDARDQFRKEAAEKKKPHSVRAPAWLRLAGDRYEIIEEKAEIVRMIYRWAVEGWPQAAITKRLNQEKVPQIAKSKFWSRGYVGHILSTRMVVGEYQPQTRLTENGLRRPIGDPIPQYYPPILSEEQWHVARAALTIRRKKPGRKPAGGEVNLFAGLLKDARSGSSVHVKSSWNGSKKSLVSYHGEQGYGPPLRFPLPAFEHAMLTCLKEINPSELLPKGDSAAEKILELSGRLQVVKDRIKKIDLMLESDEKLPEEDEEDMFATRRKLRSREKELAEELAQAEAAAANPFSEAWGNCQTLACILDNCPDKEATRTKLRSALRRVIDTIFLLVVGDRKKKHLAVQIYFQADIPPRSYRVTYRPLYAGKEGAKIDCDCLEKTTGRADWDLRDPDQVRELEQQLLAQADDGPDHVVDKDR
jgi:hypothetical protein